MKMSVILKILADMLKVDIPRNATLPDEVVVHLDVLCPSMEYRIPSKMDVVEIVTIDEDWVIDGDIRVFQNPLKPYNFTCSHDRAPIFGFGVR